MSCCRSFWLVLVVALCGTVSFTIDMRSKESFLNVYVWVKFPGRCDQILLELCFVFNLLEFPVSLWGWRWFEFLVLGSVPGPPMVPLWFCARSHYELCRSRGGWTQILVSRCEANWAGTSPQVWMHKQIRTRSATTATNGEDVSGNMFICVHIDMCGSNFFIFAIHIKSYSWSVYVLCTQWLKKILLFSILTIYRSRVQCLQYLKVLSSSGFF